MDLHTFFDSLKLTFAYKILDQGLDICTLHLIYTLVNPFFSSVTYGSSGVKSRVSEMNWGSKLDGSLSESILGL